MYQIRDPWRCRERSEPLEKLRGVGVIAKLLECGDLSSNGNNLAKDLHFCRTSLDSCTTRARCLKADKQDKVARVRQALQQMVLDATARYHSTGRNNNAGELAIVDPFRLLLCLRKRESLPLER